MRALVIGGTQFVGRHIVAEALARGHDLTLFHRGVTGPDLFPEATHLLGDRNADLSALSEGTWDVTIDASAYLPRQVRSLAGALGDRGGHYVYISTISVYADPPGPGIDEDALLREVADPDSEVIDGDTYGGLKALCERAAQEAFGDIAIVRPTYVVGPYDHTERFTWWVWRLARGGDILAPGPPDDPMQVIDARDLARFVVDVADGGRAGTWHTMTPQPPFSFSDLLDVIAHEVAPADHNVEWVTEDFLRDAGVGESTFPLWGAGDPQRFVLAADASRALAAGLSPRPLAESIRDTLEWARTSPPDGTGLSPEREAELLAAWRAR